MEDDEGDEAVSILHALGICADTTLRKEKNDDTKINLSLILITNIRGD